MNKEYLESFLKELIDHAVDIKVYNDFAPSNAEYPYVILDSSRISTNSYPEVNGELEINVWDRQNNYKTVNAYADQIQNYLNHENHNNENVIASFYMNFRNNVDDEDKSIKRCMMQLDIDFYFIKEEE